MHPAVATFVYAGLLPGAASAAITLSGCFAAAKYPGRIGRAIAACSGPVGLLAALAVANAFRGLADWIPTDSLDWLLWTPPLLGLVAAGVYAVRERRLVAVGIGAGVVLFLSWLLTPDRESLGGYRWVWWATTGAGAGWMWIAAGRSLARCGWIAPALVVVSGCGEALILAISWSLRLADFATVGAAVMGSAVLLAFILRSDRARPLVHAVVFAQLAGTGLLLAAAAVYGAMENFSDTPDFAFYLPLVIPAVALMHWRRRTDAAAEAA